MVAVIGSLLFIVAIIVAINVVCIVWLRKKKRKKNEKKELEPKKEPEPIYEMPHYQMSPISLSGGTNAVANPLYCHIDLGKNMPLAVTNPILLASKDDPTSPGIQDPVMLCEMNANLAYSSQKNI